VEAIAAILQTLKPASSTSNTSTTITSNDSNGGQALIYVWALEQKTSRRGWDKGHEQDVMVPWVLRNKPAAAAAMDRQDKKDSDADANADTKQDDKQQQQPPPPPQDQVFHRYYHLYEENELERDIRAAGGVVIESGYEKDNWWAIASRFKS
jgi:tRNA (uracil-5-)-methyltransferase TRM9